ncbi:MAG: peptide deformylase [Melioribacteraceae bacterium]|jgi:peptide deformylase|nr:peptide deformylase [Melioribacteraceae bacterium]
MSLMPVTVYGDSILRETAKPILSVDDEIIQNIHDLFETMRNANGIGLAANQVGLNKKMFIIDLKGVDGYDDFKPLVVINPEIIEYSDELIIMEEGCLSLPDLRADVERSEFIKIKYLDTDEELQEFEAESWLARVILHEYDHLIGKMIPDRVEPRIKQKLKGDLIRIMKRDIETDYQITERG